jgi:hypothetical protein
MRRPRRDRGPAIALASPQVDDRARDDVVGADLRAVAFVFAAPQFARDANVRAFSERGSVFTEAAPALDAEV